MTAEQWQFLRGPYGSEVAFTSIVLSFSGFQGRQNFYDNYAGGNFHFTIKNQTNEVANFPRGTFIQVLFANGYTLLSGKVIGITYQDYPGNTGLSTATISCQDSIVQAGKYLLQNYAGYTETTTGDQSDATNSLSDAPGVITTGTYQSIAAGTASYNGTMLNRLNLLQNTERGQIIAYGYNMFFISRINCQIVANSLVFDPLISSATSLVFTDIRRVNAYDSFMNAVALTSTTTAGAAIQQFGNNYDSQTAYGQSGYSITTVDYSSGQAAELASWLAYVQSDPNVISFEVDFNDVASNKTAINSFIYLSTAAFTFPTRGFKLNYRVPGASSDTSTVVVLEGFSVSGTPAETKFTAYFSPHVFYEMFILNDQYNGVLDQSRLGF
jgi:hypothetical protein